MHNVINKIKDWVWLALLVIGGAGCYYGISYRVQSLEESINRIEISLDKRDATTDKASTKIDVDIQNLKNEVNANTMRIELLKQEFEYLKKR